MKYVGFAAALVILAFLVMDFNSRTADLARLSGEHAQVKAEREKSKAKTKAALEEQIAYATSEAAVNEWAYQNHMVRPGDIPVVPVGGVKVTPSPTPKASGAEVEMSNLERWLLLFIDPE